ncbi:MAG: ferritin [bacterium]
MISKKMQESLNHQLNREIYSAYLYLAMSTYASSINLKGVANWFKVQMEEELSHAQKFFNYIQQQNGTIVLKDIEAPVQKYTSTIDLFEKTLEHEKKVTKLIHSLMDQAKKERDHATEIFLQWFVTEQIEEEENAADLVEKFKLAGKDSNSLLTIDSQLAERTFVPPKTGS